MAVECSRDKLVTKVIAMILRRTSRGVILMSMKQTGCDSHSNNMKRSETLYESWYQLE
jgi:hypothetical protein